MTGGVVIQHGAVLLGKYRIESVLGRGGMGIVVKARHLGLDEEVAIKLLRDDIAVDDDTCTRFVREAQAAVRLKSEHVARITDVGVFDDGKPYIVMEYLEGQDLGELIKERGRLHPSLAIDLLIQACDALAEAHSLGIVHRDIKPTNLFLTSRPDGSVLLKVLDFGISKAPTGADLSLTQTSSMLGTPAYMSPEQMRSARRVDARTDVWSLGSVLYEALEGHLPFRAESFSEMCVMVAADLPEPMDTTPPELVPIVLRCLAKTPDQRYACVADFARELARYAREPHKAQMLVNRMYRTLGRASRAATPPAGIPITPDPLTPLPRMSSPLLYPTPMPTTPTSSTHLPVSPMTLTAMEVRPKRRWMLAIVGLAAIAAGVTAIALRRTEPTEASDPEVIHMNVDLGSADAAASQSAAGSAPSSGQPAIDAGQTAADAAGNLAADSIGSAAEPTRGSDAVLIKRPPAIKKPPPRKLPPVGGGSAEPTHTVSNAGSGSAAHAGPSAGSGSGSAKPCADPFSSRRGC